MSLLVVRDKRSGFTLIELSIVLVIIAILAAAILRSQSVIDTANVTEVIKSINDVRAAVGSFKQRYHYLPGDFPIAAATPEIPNVQAACRIGGANAGNGNGRIDAIESACASEDLIRAELIKGDPLQPIANRFGNVVLASAANSGATVAFPATVQNVLVLTNISCAVALEIDRKIDDGDLSAGTVRGSQNNTFCTAPGNEGIVLASFAVAL